MSSTLQELLAPRLVLFYDGHWNILGFKGSRPVEQYSRLLQQAILSTQRLTSVIVSLTGIPEDMLNNPARLKDASVAQRMSWAAKRMTTKTEDASYCLLGLFGVNMPLLYGEGGASAFERLQRQIIEKSNDESILAWNHPVSLENRLMSSQVEMPFDGAMINTNEEMWGVNVLARQPAAFLHSSHVARAETLESLRQPPLRMTSRGLELVRSSVALDASDAWAFEQIPGLRNATSRGISIRLIGLSCATTDNQPCYMIIAQAPRHTSSNEWIRIAPYVPGPFTIESHVFRKKATLPAQLFYIASSSDRNPHTDFRDAENDFPRTIWHFQ